MLAFSESFAFDCRTTNVYLIYSIIISHFIKPRRANSYVANPLLVLALVCRHLFDKISGTMSDELDNLSPAPAGEDQLQLENTKILASGTSDHETTPQLAFAFFILGVGSLLPFNALLSVLDYYQLLFPSLSVSQVTTTAYTLPFMIVGVIATAFPPPRRFRPLCILSSYCIMCFVSILFPLLTTREEPFKAPVEAQASSQLQAIILLTATLGLANVLDQSVLYGLIGLFPEPSCTNAYNTGSAFASLLLVTMRVITRVFFDDHSATSPASLRSGYNFFFSVCTIVCLTCILVFYWMHQCSSEFAFHVRVIWERDSFPLSSRSVSDRLRSSLQTLRVVIIPAVCQLICFTFTLAFFPTIMTTLPVALRQTTSPGLASWYPLIVVSTFAVGDIFGRCFFSGKLAVQKPHILPVMTLLRFVSIPIFILLWVGFLPYLWFFVVLSVFVHGYSNGFLMNMAFVIAPLLTSEQEREAAGRLIFIMVNIGLFLGSSFAWFIQAILRSMFAL